ncbi:uncharacterized protein B0I36DRAFT_354383 [Microdochium trichocladiopsis]|uniref:Uncharacterized protein n=1 Tax=Microdochium trichocladiopsis TaxID=1682393 RepID=A0A9P8XTI9_9PEZI|nr:uncharacterized protein B0I36DRAFT_354383 [Microdochium trichocladiopsis]KAH7018065.1 hypothetical protein B0I36DRAFT_354383 [Microdochium trichocladiopsis]
MWNKYVKNRHRQHAAEGTSPQRSPVSLKTNSSLGESSPVTSSAPSTPGYHFYGREDSYMSPYQQVIDYGSPTQETMQAQPRGFPWTSKDRNGGDHRLHKPSGKAVASGQASDYAGEASPVSRYPPGTAISDEGNNNDDWPEQYYVYEPTMAGPTNSIVTESETFDKPEPYGIPYEQTNADTAAIRIQDVADKEPVGIPYRDAQAGAPPFMRAQSATEFRREQEQYKRARGGGGKGHKPSNSLPHIALKTGVNRLRKRRAFTGDLQLPALDVSGSSTTVPAIDPTESPGSQQHRLLRQLYFGQGNNSSRETSESPVTPPIETARTAVPVKLTRTASVPMRSAAPPPMNVSPPSSEDDSLKLTRHATTSASSASAIRAAQMKSREKSPVDLESFATAQMPRSPDESPVLVSATPVSHYRQLSDREHRRQGLPPAFQKPQPLQQEQEESRAGSLECSNDTRPLHHEYSPMSPYADWGGAETAEPATPRRPEAAPDRAGMLTHGIPPQHRQRDAQHARDEDGSRQSRQDAAVQQQQGRWPEDKAPRIPTLSLSTGTFGWQPSGYSGGRKDSNNYDRTARTTSRTTKQETRAGTLSDLFSTKPTSQLYKDRKPILRSRSSEEELEREMPARIDTPPIEDDIIQLYWESHTRKPWPTTPDVAGRTTARHETDAQASWDASCKAYFVAKYRERLRAENWRNEPYRESMGISPNPQDSKHALPDHILRPSNGGAEDDILPYLLGDRLFYVALVLSASLKGPHATQLWEIFGTHPGHLLSIYASLSSANRPQGSGSLDLEQYLAYAIGTNMKKPESASSSSSSIEDGPHETHASFDTMMNTITRRLDGPGICPHEMVLRQIKAQLKRLQKDLKSHPRLCEFQDPIFGCQLNMMMLTKSRTVKRWASRGTTTSEASPLYHGLQQYLISRRDILQRILADANDNLPDMTALLGATDRPFPAREDPAPPTDVTVVFDAPGSGKTRFLRDKVLETGGYYFMAPNLPSMRPPVPPKDKPISGSGSNSNTSSPRIAHGVVLANATRQQPELDHLLLGACRSFASRDTHTLYQDLSFLEGSGIVPAGRPVLGTHRRPHERLLDTELCVEPLLRARRHLLDHMPGYKSPIRWLQLQIVAASAAESGGMDGMTDVFDVAYRLFRLSPTWNAYASEDRNDQLSDISSAVPICIDEAQEIIGDHLAERILQGMVDYHEGHAYIATTSINTLPSKGPGKINNTERQLAQDVRGRDYQNGPVQGKFTSNQQQLLNERAVTSINRISSSRTNVSNAETFWSVLSHHAWSVASEMFELQSQRQAGTFGNSENNTRLPPAADGRDGDHHYPLLTRDGQPLGFSIDLLSLLPPDSSSPNSRRLSYSDRWAAVEQELLANWTVFSADVRHEAIQKECSRFFGRVRWTATFTEELLRISSSSSSSSSSTAIATDRQRQPQQHQNQYKGRLSAEDIRTASARAAERIKTALKLQIHKIRDTASLHEFLATAVEVDTCGVSRDFVGESASKLVAAGLALVYESESGSVVSVIPPELESVSAAAADPLNPRRAAFMSIAQSAERISQAAASAHHDPATHGHQRSKPPVNGNIDKTLSSLLTGTLGRYHLYDSGLDLDRGEGGGRRWTAEEWLMAHYTTSSTSDNSFYQSLPNFFFVPDVDGGNTEPRDGSAGGSSSSSGRGSQGGLGSCMFFLTDYEDMRRRILCVVQFPPKASDDAARRASSCPSALSPLTTRSPDQAMWSRLTPPQSQSSSSSTPPPPTGTRPGIASQDHPASRSTRLVHQIQHLLPRIHSSWPALYISVGADGTHEEDTFLAPGVAAGGAPAAAVGAVGAAGGGAGGIRPPVTPWSKVMDPSSRQPGGGGGAAYYQEDGQAYTDGGERGTTASPSQYSHHYHHARSQSQQERFGAARPGDNHRRAFSGSSVGGGGGTGRNGDHAQSAQLQLQRPSYAVRVDEERFAEVCGWALRKGFLTHAFGRRSTMITMVG